MVFRLIYQIYCFRLSTIYSCQHLQHKAAVLRLFSPNPKSNMVPIKLEDNSSPPVSLPISPDLVPSVLVREMSVVRERPYDSSSFNRRKKKLQSYHIVFLLRHVPAGNTRSLSRRRSIIAHNQHKRCGLFIQTM